MPDTSLTQFGRVRHGSACVREADRVLRSSDMAGRVPGSGRIKKNRFVLIKSHLPLLPSFSISLPSLVLDGDNDDIVDDIDDNEESKGNMIN